MLVHLTNYSGSFSTELVSFYRDLLKRAFRTIESAELLFHTRLHSSRIALEKREFIENRARARQ